VGPLTLGIDGWRLHGQLTGVGRYISNVLRHWTKEAVADRFGRVTLYTPAPIDRTVIDLPGAIEESVVGPHWRQLLWQNVRLARAARDDILFCPSYARPVTARGKTVVTTFEATQKLFPELYPRRTRLLNAPLYGWSARRSALVITPSVAAAQDIARAYGVDEQSIRVVPLAPAEIFRPLRNDRRTPEVVRRYLGTPEPYFLYVGKLTARRNLPMLVQAFAEFKRSSPSRHKLLVVGLNTTGVDLGGIARREGIENDFRYVEYVSDEDLSLLYSGAEAFVLPYTYEALSLTALEAQAAGCPVLTVDTPGLREQTGGHALFIPRADTRELVAAMQHLGDDDALRHALVAGGLAHASRFTWERCSHATLDVLAEAASL
jgi:glycosyltransferase involved in cell wall biosynthesis